MKKCFCELYHKLHFLEGVAEVVAIGVAQQQMTIVLDRQQFGRELAQGITIAMEARATVELRQVA